MAPVGMDRGPARTGRGQGQVRAGEGRAGLSRAGLVTTLWGRARQGGQGRGGAGQGKAGQGRGQGGEQGGFVGRLAAGPPHVSQIVPALSPPISRTFPCRSHKATSLSQIRDSTYLIVVMGPAPVACSSPPHWSWPPGSLLGCRRLEVRPVFAWPHTDFTLHYTPSFLAGPYIGSV